MIYPINEYNVSSFEEYYKIVSSHKGGQYIYRGQTDSKWKIESSLNRSMTERKNNWLNCPNRKPGEKIEDINREMGFENKLIEKFKRESSIYDISDKHLINKLEILSVMQHYRCPTRLIDFTHSPFVALFFSAERGLTDFCVFIINLIEIKTLNSKDNNLIDQIFNLNPSCENDLFVYEPVTSNQRILSQQGNFLLSKSPFKSMDDLIQSNYKIRNSISKLLFKSNLRNSMIEILDKMNINSRTIYPGFEGFCKSFYFELYKG